MATVHLTIAPAPGQKPVVSSRPTDSVSATSSGSSALVANITGYANQIWTATVDGGDVYMKFNMGADTDAGADPGRFLVLDGETRDFICTQDGELCYIKDKA